MKKRVQKGINFLTGFVLLSSLHCMIMAVFFETSQQTLGNMMLYFPVAVLLSISEKKSRHFWQYLVCSALALGFMNFCIRNDLERGTALFLTAATILSYFISRAKKKVCWLDEPSYPFLALFLGMYLLQLKFPSELLKSYAVFGTGIYYLLCLYQVNLSQMNHLLDMDSELERFPMRRLMQSNWLMMGIQTVIVTVGMCIAPFFKIDGILYKLAKLVRDIIAWMLSGLETQEVAEGTETAAEENLMTLPQQEETSAFLQMLLDIANILSWILVIVITGYIIYRVVRYLYRLYLDFDLNSVENGDQIERIHKTGTKEEKQKLKKQKQETLFWDRSPNARIRKHYKKRVMKDWKNVPGASLMPEEIEQKVVLEETEKQRFHTYYEKARYGKEECTKEEALNYRKI